MSLAYIRASRFPSDRGDSDPSSSPAVVTPPTIDLTATDTSLLLRCDHPAAVSVFVSGNPLPVVKWFVGSRRIREDSSGFRVSGGGAEDGGRKRVLEIARVTAELEEGIRLEAVNCAGSDRIRINVKTYKFLTGRSSSELTRSATLPPSLLRHRFQPENNEKEFREVKTMTKEKTQNRFQMTKEDYEKWEKEMESRSHMRSIDDIIDNLSDDEEEEEEESEENPEKENKTKSCDIFPPTTNKNQPLPPPPPPPPSNEDQSLNTPLAPHQSDATNSGQLKLVPESASLPDCYVKMIYKGATNKAKDNVCGPHTEAPIWEMFGVKLSEICRNILSVNGSFRKDGGLSQVTRESENFSPSCRIHVRSVPVDRKYLGGSRPSNSPAKSHVYPEIAKKKRVDNEKELSRGAVHGASRGDDDDADRRLNRPKETKVVPGGGEKRPPSARPPLAPKPSFSEVRVANRVTPSPGVVRPYSADAVKRSTSLPKDSNLVNRDLPAKIENFSIEDNAPLPNRPPRLDLSASTGKDFSEEKNRIPAEKSASSGGGSIPGAQKSTIRTPKTTEIDETHFDCSPKDVAKYQIPEVNKEAEEGSQAVDDTGTKSSGEQVSKAHKEPVSKKPPVARDKPFWRPAVGERTPRSNAPTILIERQTNNNPYFPAPSGKPLISVRRVRSQSSGKPSDEASNFLGLVSGSTSANQLSQCQETDGPQDHGGEKIEKIQASAATRSEGLLTARKLTLLPPPPCPSGGHEQKREWRSCVLPPSKSVDVLDSSRGLYGTPRVGRRSLSKEWNVVTVTTKEEIVILRRPSHQGAAVKPAVTSSAANPENKVTWKLPLGPGRPFAV